MRDSAASAILAELARRRPALVVSQADAAADMAAQLRAFYHPKQAAFFTSKAKRRATKKTRRAGATSGGCRELIARSIEYPGHRATYVTSTRKEARERAWQNDTRSGLVDVLRQFGVSLEHPSLEVQLLGGVRAEIRDQAMVIEFDNGSRIDLFGADDERALRKQRGLAKHVYWIDEAQDFRFIERFYDAVVIGSLTDYDGECWFSGTPGRDCTGMFYDITKDDSDDGDPLAGWEVHTIAVVDNPYFGRVSGGSTANGQLCYFVEDNLKHVTGPYLSYVEADSAAIKVRWDRTAGAAMRAKGWKGDEPDFVREWLGRWTRTDARYVYPVHTVPQHDLLYAPQRLTKNPFVGTHPRFDGHPPWLNVKKAISDLPKKKLHNKFYQWMFAIGADFGYQPDPFAITVWAFTHELQDVYELFSWKCTRVHTDDQGMYLKLIWSELDNVVILVGDPAGKQDDFEVWRTRMGLPIDEANKRGKNTLEEFLADDIRRGRVHLRIDSPLHDEMRHLVYLPTKPGKTREVAKHRRSSDNKVHGDHCCFVAGTRVETEFGLQPIESVIVGTQVLTRAGWKPVQRSWKTGTRQTWKLTTDDSRSVVGTADHPIWVETGWKSLAELTPSDILTTCNPKLSPSQTVDTVAIPNTLTDLCASTFDEASRSVASRMSNIFTARSGNPSTVRCPTSITCTTETRTLSTTPPRTLLACSGRATSANTPARPNESQCLAPISTPPANSPRNGMALQTALLGMQSTGVKSWQPVPWFPSRVDDVESRFFRRTPTPNTAAMPAKRQFDETAESTTKIAPALSAKPYSVAVASAEPGDAARVRVLRVEATGLTEDVYNLTVEDCHEYYVEGILVSNCDASRYSYADLTHFLSKLPTDKPERGSPAALAAEEELQEKKLDDREQRRAEQMAEGDEEMLYAGNYD